MHKIIVLAAVMSLAPVGALALGSGMGLYSTASFGGGYPTDINPQEEYETATQLMDKQEYDAAVRHLIRVLRVEQGNADIPNDIGYATWMSGDFSTSLDCLQRAIARDPDLKIAHANLGQLYLAIHQPDQAQSQCDALKHLCPNGCDEADTLAQLVSAYTVAAKTGAPPAK